MNILAIQNYQLTPPGVLGKCIQQQGGTIEILIPTFGDKLALEITSFDGLIILGGPMNAEDDTHHPQLQDMVNLVCRFYAENKPILGVCLGAQIIARAFGKRVYKHNVVEIGFTPMFLSGALVANDPLLNGYSNNLHLMQWHFDTFELPEEATLLMFGEQCKNQAYRIGRNVYGFQPHIEVTKEILQSWIDEKDEFAERNYPNFSKEITQQMEKHLDNSIAFCSHIGRAWIDLVKARIQAASPQYK